MEAKIDLDSKLINYVKRQVFNDFNYVYNISENAGVSFDKGNINELIAEVMVLENNTPDARLFDMVKELFRNGSNGKTK